MTDSRMRFPTVGNIRKALEGVPDDMPVGLTVYGHSWYGPCHTVTHGGMRVREYRFSDGSPIMLFAQGEPSDGYMLKPTTPS